MLQENIPRPAPDQLPAIIESLLFVAEEPQSIGTLSKILNTPRQGIERAIETLIESTADRGIYVQRQGDRVQLSTTPEAAPYIEYFLEIDHGHLTRASLETLAIIAYPQPATRGPPAAPGAPPRRLHPRETWADKDAYDVKAKELAALFRGNAAKYDMTDAVRAAGPG